MNYIVSRALQVARSLLVSQIFGDFINVDLSVSFDETDLKYKWKNPVGSDVFIYDAEMAQFNVMSVVRNLKHPVYHSRKYCRYI